jgi:hypothetical protein
MNTRRLSSRGPQIGRQLRVEKTTNDIQEGAIRFLRSR